MNMIHMLYITNERLNCALVATRNLLLQRGWHKEINTIKIQDAFQPGLSAKYDLKIS